MSAAPETTTLPEPGAAPVPAPAPAHVAAPWVRVRTTLPRRPFPPNAARKPILTPRLVLRPLTPEDVGPVHALRTQPEVMRWSALGRPDRDADETREKIEIFFPPRDTGSFNFAICLRGVEGGDADAAGELVGLGGCHHVEGPLGWPVVGYMFRKEHWGKGLATEFLRAFLKAWDALEREEVELEVDEQTVAGEERGEGGLVQERILAITAVTNTGSHGVLRKSGFKWLFDWVTEDLHESARGALVTLPLFRYFPGEGKGEGQTAN